MKKCIHLKGWKVDINGVCSFFSTHLLFSLFCIPIGVPEEIEKIMRNFFFWKGYDNMGGEHLVALQLSVNQRTIKGWELEIL